MKKYRYYIPLQFLLFLVSGIVLQSQFSFWILDGSIELLLFIFLLISFWIAKRKVRIFVGFFIFLLVGMSRSYHIDQRVQSHYFANHLESQSSIALRLDKRLNPTKNQLRFEADVIQVNQSKSTGKLVVSIPKDSTSQFFIDEVILTNQLPKKINPPLNPYQFDYRKYMANRDVHYQLYLNGNCFVKPNRTRNSIYGIADRLRMTVSSNLKSHNFSEVSYGLLNALLLGRRGELSKEVIDDFKNAGAIHILAISGLHIGIILFVLNFLFKPLEFFRFGKTIKLALILLLLWFFGLIAGLSPSIVRSVTMFSFVAIGIVFKKRGSVLYSIFTSMLILLLINPNYLFEVGFQLSYLAVFGIVLLQPKIYKWYISRFTIIDYFWKLLSVSLAAQIFVLPVSLYYFHQFPGLFWLTNLLIIPLLGILLMLGILTVLLSTINLLPKFLVFLFDKLLIGLSTIVKWIADVEQFNFNDLNISFLEMTLFYVIILGSIFLMIKRNLKYGFVVLFGVLSIQLYSIYSIMMGDQKNEFIIFHKTKASVLMKRNGQNSTIYQDNKKDLSYINIYKDYIRKEEIKKIYKDSLPGIIGFKNHEILIVDSLGIYQIQNLQDPIILLTHSPKINLDRLIQTLHPKEIIADGSNYPSFIRRWESSACKNKIPFHVTVREGAYILK